MVPALKSASLCAFALCAFAVTGKDALADDDFLYVAPAWSKFLEICGNALRHPDSVVDFTRKDDFTGHALFARSEDGNTIHGTFDTDFTKSNGGSHALLAWTKHRYSDLRKCTITVFDFGEYDGPRDEIAEAKVRKIVAAIKQGHDVEIVGGIRYLGDSSLYTYSVAKAWPDLAATVEVTAFPGTFTLNANLIVETDNR